MTSTSAPRKTGTRRANPPRGLVAFEKDRGVSSVELQGAYAYLVVSLRASDASDLGASQIRVLSTLAGRGVSINLVKVHGPGMSFVVNEADLEPAQAALAGAGFETQCVPSVSMVSVQAAGMRSLCGVMSRIAGALLRAEVPIVQVGDGPDIVFCLVPSRLAESAASSLRTEFGVEPPVRPIVVQKFGGKSVGTAEARRLAAERVQEAIDDGYCPVVVVSAIGRRGEPYATDTLLEQLAAVEPGVTPTPRERDLLMSCGETISTVIMAQTLKARGLTAVALTGGQAGIVTDYRYGDAQIVDIDPTYILKLLNDEGADVVVVAGFQGVTEHGAITTLGRGGSDTTAAALGAALGAEKVEIYTHVDGVMTADPEAVPDARTLAMVTYEEVANMAHQGAKVLHPRAAEIAMMHQIPLWVKSSIERARGTLIAPLAELQPTVKRAVTGVATLARLAYFTITGLDPANRADAEQQVYEALGSAGINLYLSSLGPGTNSFIVDAEHALTVERVLDDLALPFELVPDCEMVSVVALNMWDESGFLHRIAAALQARGIGLLQMADSECSVSCLVLRDDAPRAVAALHAEFGLGEAQAA